MNENVKNKPTQLAFGVAKIALAICLFFIAVNISACFGTVEFVKQASGEKARLKFQILYSEMPNPMIHWVESPHITETALTLQPPLPDCDKIRIFVNPKQNDPHELSDELIEIETVTLFDEKEEMLSWQYIPSDQCAVLLTVGSIIDEKFEGLSASIRSGIFKRYAFSFQEDLPPEGGWVLVPLAAIYDVWFAPFELLLFGFGSTLSTPDEVTLSFNFPDGSRKETKLNYDEALEILDNHFPYLFNMMIKDSMLAEIWTRAALLKLRLDFKQVSSTTAGNLRDNARLLSVGGYEGSWWYIVNKETMNYRTDLLSNIGKATSLQFDSNAAVKTP